MAYVIRDEKQLTRKDGSKFTHVSYFKGPVMGLFNEFCAKPQDAKQFRTKALCDTNIRNRFGSRRKGMTAHRI